jgi:hypothetical protein
MFTNQTWCDIPRNGKFLPVGAMEAYLGGSRGITPHILNLRTRWNWVLNFVSQLLFLSGKNQIFKIAYIFYTYIYYIQFVVVHTEVKRGVLLSLFLSFLTLYV